MGGITADQLFGIALALASKPNSKSLHAAAGIAAFVLHRRSARSVKPTGDRFRIYSVLNDGREQAGVSVDCSN